MWLTQNSFNENRVIVSVQKCVCLGRFIKELPDGYFILNLMSFGTNLMVDRDSSNCSCSGSFLHKSIQLLMFTDDMPQVL